MRPARAATLGAAWLILALRAGSAQVTVTVDVGASHVEYDGFLPSAAASVSPGLRFNTKSASFIARGTWLGFESGNASVQGLIAGSVFTAPGSWRGEVGATAGLSAYEDFADFAHALLRGRLHYLWNRGGAWVGVTGGRAAYENATRPVLSAAAGVWRSVGRFNVTLGLSATQVGDTAYSDLEAAGHWRTAQLEIDGLLGIRGGNGGGQGVYGEAVGALIVSRAFAITLGAGRYPTDPIRGSVSGRYATIGVRFTGSAPRTTPYAPGRNQPPVASLAASNGHHALASAMVEVDSAGAILLIRAPGAQLVEVMGDFTDWEPVALTRAGEVWRLSTRLHTGTRRFNVRIDGGPWSVPQGATLEQDDFGSTVGTVAVP